MRDMQAHASKIRSDAAECLVLSNLVTEERRPLFARIAEHLNSLALEIETEAVTGVADEPGVMPDQQTELTDRPAAPSDDQLAVRSWRLLPWSLLAVLMVLAGGVLWTVNRAEFTLSNLLQTTGSEFHASAHDLAALLSEEKSGRKVISDQLRVLMTQLDGLTKELDQLKSTRAGTATPLSNGGFGQEAQSPATEAKPPAKQEPDSRARSTSPAIPPAAEAAASAPENTTPADESSDQVGTISASRTEPESDPRTIGPAGCTHFRSFNRASGTYTTFDGRRRPCRQP